MEPISQGGALSAFGPPAADLPWSMLLTSCGGGTLNTYGPTRNIVLVFHVGLHNYSHVYTNVVVDERATRRQAVFLLYEMRCGNRVIDDGEDIILELGFREAATLGAPASNKRKMAVLCFSL